VNVRREPQGYTLVEMMIVVAIVGILSAIGASALSKVVTGARVRGAARSVSQMVADARALSVTQHCPHFVQINGTSYAPSSPPAGMVKTKATISLVRKGNCASTNSFFEVSATHPLLSDKVLQSQTLGEPLMPNNGLQIVMTAPAGVVTSNLLTAASITIAYGTDGARTFAVDSGSGFANDATNNAANTNFTFVFRHLATDANNPSVVVPNAAAPTLSRRFHKAPSMMLAAVQR
jgi:prepilin-type N-terminal cleavage/methylation domain-containing protein